MSWGNTHVLKKFQILHLLKKKNVGFRHLDLLWLLLPKNTRGCAYGENTVRMASYQSGKGMKLLKQEGLPYKQSHIKSHRYQLLSPLSYEISMRCLKAPLSVKTQAWQVQFVNKSPAKQKYPGLSTWISGEYNMFTLQLDLIANSYEKKNQQTTSLYVLFRPAEKYWKVRNINTFRQVIN